MIRSPRPGGLKPSRLLFKNVNKPFVWALALSFEQTLLAVRLTGASPWWYSLSK